MMKLGLQTEHRKKKIESSSQNKIQNIPKCAKCHPLTRYRWKLELTDGRKVGLHNNSRWIRLVADEKRHHEQQSANETDNWNEYPENTTRSGIAWIVHMS